MTATTSQFHRRTIVAQPFATTTNAPKEKYCRKTTATTLSLVGASSSQRQLASL
jgi:hypothetical protein